MMCSSQETGAEEINSFLLERYGPLLGHEALTKVLGYANADAFERSVQRGHVSLKLVRLPGRRGMFALAADVAKYLIEVSSGEEARPVVRSERKIDEPKN